MAALAAGCALWALTGPVCAESPETLDAFVERDDAQLLVLGVHAANLSLHDGILAYADGGKVLVPLLDLCEALGIPVSGSSAQGHAEGWFRDEGRRFVLDTQRRRLHVDGLPRDADWSRIERHAEDLYVPLEFFTEWFGLKIETQLAHSRLWIEHADDLPVQQRRMRLARWSERARSTPVAHEDGRDITVTPRWLDWPALDFGISAAIEPSRTTWRANLLAAGDLMGTEALLSVSWRSAHDRDAGLRGRLRMQRRGIGEDSPDWSFGDLQAPVIPLLVSANDGLGIQVGTWVDDAEGDAFTTEIRGEAFDGWDAELYRNQELLALITIERDHRYVFREVPLQPGLNLFRVVLYGPQGQRRERLHRITLGGTLLGVGERRWRAFALMPGRGVFGDIDESRVAMEAERLGAMTGAGYRWALSRHATASVEAFSASLSDGERRIYGSARIQGGVGGWWLDGQWLQADGGGRALRFVAQRGGERVDGGIEYQGFDGFLSPDTERGSAGDRPLQSLRARWNFRVTSKVPLALEAERLRTRRETGETHDDEALRMRVSRRFGKVNLALSAETAQDNLRKPSTVAGMLLSYRAPRLDVSAQLGREFAPNPGLRQATVTAQWALDERLRLRALVARNPASRRPDRIELGLTWKARRWSLQLGASSGESGGYRLDAALFFSLQRGQQGWRADARPASASGNAEVEVFLDKNANGRLDADDLPLPGVALRATSTGETLRTGANGRAYFTHIPAQTQTHLRLLEESLDQPFWLPSVPIVSVKLHAGARVRVPFPVVPTVEIDGTVFVQTNAGRKPAANVELELCDAHGVVVRKIRTEFDGSYLLDRLPPGDYHLRLSAEQANRLSLEMPASRRVSLGDERETATLDWILSPRLAP